MGAPATDLEKYAEATTTTEEQKIFDRPEVKELPNGGIDFGDEDEDSAKKEVEACTEAEVVEATEEEK